MEKLIELFKDYVDNYWTDTRDIEREYWVIDDWQWFLYWTREYLYEIIVSKKFWFIEWLYNHKKMTLERLKFSDLYWDINDWVWTVDNIIMHLSISEKPIELLISMLK